MLERKTDCNKSGTKEMKVRRLEQRDMLESQTDCKKCGMQEMKEGG
jgi:hypothetical protein